MNAHDPTFPDDRLFDAPLLRALLCLIVAGVLSWVVATSTFAETLMPAAETGGSGAIQAPTVSEMLRGDLSPVAAEPEVAVDMVQRTVTVSEMLRGDQSPIAIAAVA